MVGVRKLQFSGFSYFNDKIILNIKTKKIEIESKKLTVIIFPKILKLYFQKNTSKSCDSYLKAHSQV